MPEQHVGRLSDAIDNGDGGAAGRLRRTMQPTGKVYRGGSTDLGDGDFCPVDGHGRMYVYRTKQWCPHSDHSSNKRKEQTDG